MKTPSNRSYFKKQFRRALRRWTAKFYPLYAKGMTTREIVATFKEMYDADVSPSLISKVTDAVKEQVTERGKTGNWMRCTPLFIWTALSSKSVRNGSVINKAVFRTGYQHRRPEKNYWVCGWPKMNAKVLAKRADGAENLGPSGHPDCPWMV